MKNSTRIFLAMIVLLLPTVVSAQIVSTPDGFDAARAQVVGFFDGEYADIEQVAFEVAVENNFRVAEEDIVTGNVFNVYIPVNNTTSREISVSATVASLVGGAMPYTITDPSDIVISGNGNGYLIVTIEFTDAPTDGGDVTIRFTTNIRATATVPGSYNPGGDIYP